MIKEEIFFRNLLYPLSKHLTLESIRTPIPLKLYSVLRIVEVFSPTRMDDTLLSN